MACKILCTCLKGIPYIPGCCCFFFIKSIRLYVFGKKKIPQRFVIHIDISTHFYYLAQDDGKSFCSYDDDDDAINIDVSHATTDDAHMPSVFLLNHFAFSVHLK